MCRNIKNLFNFDPPATDSEINDAALQYVRKLSGYNKPSLPNQLEFDRAVEEVAQATKKLMESLTTNTSPRNREIEARKARERNEKRFGMQN